MITTSSNIMISDSKKTNEKAKRMAEESPNNAPTRKRSALGDVTNVSWPCSEATCYFNILSNCPFKRFWLMSLLYRLHIAV